MPVGRDITAVRFVFFLVLLTYLYSLASANTCGKELLFFFFFFVCSYLGMSPMHCMLLLLLRPAAHPNDDATAGEVFFRVFIQAGSFVCRDGGRDRNRGRLLFCFNEWFHSPSGLRNIHVLR